MTSQIARLTPELTPAMRAHERRLQRSLRDVLLSDYTSCTLEEIAADFEISEATLRRWMQRLGIGTASRTVLVDLHASEETAGRGAAGQSLFIHEPEADTPSDGRGKADGLDTAAVGGSAEPAHEGA